MAPARRWLAMLAVALALPACLNPDDIFPVQGTVASAGPVAGQVVRLLRRPRLAPYGGCDGTGLGPFKEAVTDADGGYGFEVFRAQALSLNTGLTGGYCMRAVAEFPSGSVAWNDFPYFIQAPTVVAPLRDWRAAPRLEAEVLAFEPVLPWPDDAGGLDGSVPAQLEHQVVVLTGDGGVLWKEADRSYDLDTGASARVALRLDGARLEDFAGVASLRARLDEPVEFPGLGFGAVATASELRAGQALPVAGTRAPPSRGLPCPEVGTPCPLTDGDLTVVDAGGVEEVTLALATPGPLSAVVLRGVSAASREVTLLLGQVDGGTLPPLVHLLPLTAFDQRPQYPEPVFVDGGLVFPPEPAVGLYAVVGLDAGEPVARVTLRFPGGLRSVAEVSLAE